MRYVKFESTAPLCTAQESHRAGSDANKPPQWSAERRASPARGLRKRFARDARASGLALRAYVTGPPTGAAAPERLSALRSLVIARENLQASEEPLPRENDDACVLLRCHSGAERSEEPGIHTPQHWLWIPGSPLSRRPGMTTGNLVAPVHSDAIMQPRRPLSDPFPEHQQRTNKKAARK
jgi:hypothetical protein